MEPTNRKRPPASTSSPAGDTSLTPAQKELHEGFVQSVQVLRTDFVRTTLLLNAVAENRVHIVLGFTNMADYARQFAGFTPRQTRELMQLGRKLRSLHDVAAAIDSGRLPWTKAREICRYARPEDQQQYIELARSVSRTTLHRILVGGDAGETAGTGNNDNSDEIADPGAPATAMGRPAPALPPSLPEPPIRRSLPQLAPRGAPAPPAPARCYVTLRFTPEQHARWAALLEQASDPASSTMEERLLAGLAATGRPDDHPSYLVVILQCPRCGENAIVTSRGEAPAPAPLVAAARCDGVVEDHTGRQRATVAPRLRRLALQRARHRCEARDCTHTRFLEVHHRRPVCAGGGDGLENLVVLCSRCHRAVHEGERRVHAAAGGAAAAARTLGDAKV